MDWDLLIAAAGSFVAALLGSAVGLVLGQPAPAGHPRLLGERGRRGRDEHRRQRGLGARRRDHARARGTGGLADRRLDGAALGRRGVRRRALRVERPEGFLLGLISVVLFYSGLDILLSLRPGPEKPGDPRAFAAVSGAIIGLIGGAVGLILGTLRMPALLKGVGLTAHKAVGTNLVVGFFLGVSGFLGHLVRLEVEWDVLAVSVAAAIPGAWLGARLTGRMSEATLKRAIGVALLVISIVIAAAALS